MVIFLVVAAVLSVVVVVCDPFFIGRTVIMELLEVVDSVPVWTLTPGDIILWDGNKKYHRTVDEVNEGNDGGLVVEFDDDLDDSWLVSEEQANDLVDLYSY